MLWFQLGTYPISLAKYCLLREPTWSPIGSIVCVRLQNLYYHRAPSANRHRGGYSLALGACRFQVSTIPLTNSTDNDNVLPDPTSRTFAFLRPFQRHQPTSVTHYYSAPQDPSVNRPGGWGPSTKGRRSG